MKTLISQGDTFVSYKSTKTQDIGARGCEINQKVTLVLFHAFSVPVLNKLRAGAFQRGDSLFKYCSVFVDCDTKLFVDFDVRLGLMLKKPYIVKLLYKNSQKLLEFY